MPPLAHHGVADSVVEIVRILTTRHAGAHQRQRGEVVLIHLHLQHRTRGLPHQRQHGGFLESIVGKACVADAVEILAHPDDAAVEAHALLVEILLQRQVQQVAVCRAEQVGVVPGGRAETAVEEILLVSRVVIQPPGTHHIRAQPGAAVHVVLDESLVHTSPEQPHGVVRIVAGSLVINSPQTHTQLHAECCARGVVDSLLVGRGVLTGNHQPAVIEHMVALRLSCRLARHRVAAHPGSCQQREEKMLEFHIISEC